MMAPLFELLVGLLLIAPLDDRRDVVAASPPVLPPPVADAVELRPRSPPGKHKIDVLVRHAKRSQKWPIALYMSWSNSSASETIINTIYDIISGQTAVFIWNIFVITG